MLTEEEAKKKWCPEVRLTASDGEWHTNRPPGNAPDAVESYLCCASMCMAWRWGIIEHQRNLPASDRTRAGYCGKAGAP